MRVKASMSITLWSAFFIAFWKDKFLTGQNVGRAFPCIGKQAWLARIHSDPVVSSGWIEN